MMSQMTQEQKYSEDKNFLTDRNNPKELKLLALDYLDFLELATYINEATKSDEDETIKNLIFIKYEEKRKNDLVMLNKELYDATKIKTELTLDIIIQRITDFSLIERSVAHACYSNPVGANKYLLTYLNDENRQNNIIDLFLKYCHKIEIEIKPQGIKAHVILGDDRNVVVPDKVIKMKEWIKIIFANISANTPIIVDRYPEQINAIMIALHFIQEVNNRYPNELWKIDKEYSKHSFEQIIYAIKTFLLCLNKNHDKYYKLSLDDNILIEKRLIERTKSLKTEGSIRAFYAKDANNLYLHKTGSDIYKTIDNNKLSEKRDNLKENVLAILQKRLCSNEKKSNLISMLRIKRDAILYKNKMKWKTFFSSTTYTHLKLHAVDECLKKLDDITDLDGLKTLTENMMLNKNLISRRNFFSLSKSDTYQKLEKFYDTNFSDSNKHILS